MRSPKGADEKLWFRTASRGRICTTLVEPSGSATEIVEKSGEVSSDECEQLLAKIKKLRKSEGEVRGLLSCLTTALSLSFFSGLVHWPGLVLLTAASRDRLHIVGAWGASHGNDATGSSLGLLRDHP